MEPTISPSRSEAYAIPFAIVVAGLAIAGAIYFGNGNKSSAQGISLSSLAPVTENDHVLGNPKAKVVIVEYSDTECPFCKTFQKTMNTVMSEYGKNGTVAWVYRHFPLPFHDKAQKEAEAAECAAKIAGDTKFWEYLNKVFEITPANNGLDPAKLPEIAKEFGIDQTAFEKCLSGGEAADVVKKDLASGRKAGVSGTPRSFILVNGKVVDTIEGAQPYETVKAMIDEALK